MELTLWQWGVMAFLAVGWSVVQMVRVWGQRREVEERERILRETYGPILRRLAERMKK